MADPHGAVEIQGKAVEGTVAASDPDAIVADIERTRENLARTIDSLADRVSPANNVRRLKEKAAEQAARPQVQYAAAAVGLTLIGLVIYKIWSRKS